MISIQPAWLGVLIIVIAGVAAVLAVTGGLYFLAPRARRFIKGDHPVWWVRDVLIAVFVVVLVLFGQNYLVSASDAHEQGQDRSQDQGQDQGQDQRIADLNFVRFRSSESYQLRPFRRFDLRDTNLAGLQLKGADFTGANLAGADLTGTVLSEHQGTPEAPGQPGIPGVRALLPGVNLCNAVLADVDLRWAFLINANLTGADLSFARLQRAALNGSDLSAATLPSDPSYLAGIYYDENTIWPEGFQPPPSATGARLNFLESPLNSKLYGDIQRPACDS